ncbi:MAG: geranylgeranylglyceryl/heptaprenylglyceryl phosphate synthase [Candidatus Hodarchaeales archaeon]|jgi:putative glycerol-1-phosphate prenyltransferase
MLTWSCSKITKLAILIDPNKGEATERMFNALKEILTESKDPSSLPLEIWVGDSSEIYRGVHGYLKKLHRLDIKLPPVVIFPGHPLQISPLADFIQMPTLLNTYRFRIKLVVKLGKKYHWLSKWCRRIIGKHWPIDRKYGYVVLGPRSSVGKKLRAKDLNDEQAYGEITTKWRDYWSMIYLEAGSGRFDASIAERLDLVRRVKEFVLEKNATLITGGGIRTREQVEVLVRAGSDLVVVSTVLEQSENPKELMDQFIEVVYTSQ